MPRRAENTIGYLDLDQSSPSCHGDGFCPTQNVELCENIAQMALNGEFAYEKFRADFLIALAVGKQLQNIQLAACEGFAPNSCHGLLHHWLGDAGFATVYFANAIQQLLAPCIFQQIPLCSRFDGPVNVVVAIVRGEDDDSRGTILSANCIDRANTV